MRFWCFHDRRPKPAHPTRHSQPKHKRIALTGLGSRKQEQRPACPAPTPSQHAPQRTAACLRCPTQLHRDVLPQGYPGSCQAQVHGRHRGRSRKRSMGHARLAFPQTANLIALRMRLTCNMSLPLHVIYNPPACRLRLLCPCQVPPPSWSFLCARQLLLLRRPSCLASDSGCPSAMRQAPRASFAGAAGAGPRARGGRALVCVREHANRRSRRSRGGGEAGVLPRRAGRRRAQVAERTAGLGRAREAQEAADGGGSGRPAAPAYARMNQNNNTAGGVPGPEGLARGSLHPSLDQPP